MKEKTAVSRRSRLKRIVPYAIVLPALALIVVIIGLHLAARPVPPHPLFDNFDDGPLVIAHADDTGKYGLWPGNTMPYLEGIAELGVDMLEMDIHMTKDGHIILMHDAEIDRTTDGTGRISELTLAEVQAAETAVNWTPDDGKTYPWRGQGLSAPTLDQVLTRFNGYPMVIEIKQETPSLVEPFCQQIRRQKMENNILVASYSHQTITEFRAVCPEVATSASGDETRRFVYLNFLFLSGIIEPEYVAFQVPQESGGIPITTARFVKAAQRQGVAVQVWTVNDRDEMKALLDIGVDGILTDRPDHLREVMESK